MASGATDGLQRWLLALALGGCGDEARKADEAARESAAEVREAAALHAEYGALAGAERLRRFDAGVTVRGATTAADDHGDEGGGVAIRLPVGGGGAVVLRFAEGAAPAAATEAVITARCAIDAMVGAVLYLDGCVPVADPEVAPPTGAPPTPGER